MGGEHGRTGCHSSHGHGQHGPSGTSAGRGYCSMQVDDTLIYSCYCTPNCSIGEFSEFLAGLEGDVRGRQAANVLVVGDFNARSREWASRVGDKRGELLLERRRRQRWFDPHLPGPHGRRRPGCHALQALGALGARGLEGPRGRVFR